MMVTFPVPRISSALEHSGVPEDARREARHRTAGAAAADIIESCLTNTSVTSMSWGTPATPGAAEVFVRTGDIPAMWLRDSTAQMRPYLALAADPRIGDVLVGVSRRSDPLRPAGPVRECLRRRPHRRARRARPRPVPQWEVGSGSASTSSTRCARHFSWRTRSGRRPVASTAWTTAFAAPRGRSSEPGVSSRRTSGRRMDSWSRPSRPFSSDTLPLGGRGAPVAWTGMTWSGFRPSDDRCTYGYLVPANAMASTCLHGLAALAESVLHDTELRPDVVGAGGRDRRGNPGDRGGGGGRHSPCWRTRWTAGAMSCWATTPISPAC